MANATSTTNPTALGDRASPEILAQNRTGNDSSSAALLGRTQSRWSGLFAATRAALVAVGASIYGLGMPAQSDVRARLRAALP